MTPSPPERRADIWTGAIALWIGLIVIGVIIARFTPGATANEAPRYIAYFDDSGGVAKNDSVSWVGRRVGRIVSTGVVQREGRTQARIEFEIYRSKLREDGVPADAVLKVRPAGPVGRPSLVIAIDANVAPGQQPVYLKAGDDWPTTVDPTNPDPLRTMREDIRRFDANVDQFNAVMADEELFDGLRRFAGTARTFLEVEGANVLAGFNAGRKALLEITEAGPGLDETTGALRANEKSISKGLGEFAAVAKDIDRALARAMGGVQDARARLGSARSGMASVVQATDRKTVGGFFAWLRELSSSWAASMDRARFDPSMAGKLPPRRIWRGFFNGGAGPLDLPDRIEGDKKEPPPQRYKPPPREPFSSKLSSE
ncbi:MAG: hypothetical protein IT462_17130 [Planctomycetes bacterium]|nr:hypothetical protein [Planctomycetota bacterium]